MTHNPLRTCAALLTCLTCIPAASALDVKRSEVRAFIDETSRDELTEARYDPHQKQLVAEKMVTSFRDFIDKHDQVYVVEQNRDAQLRSLLTLDLEVDPAKLIPMLHYNGMPISAGFVMKRILSELAKGQAA